MSVRILKGLDVLFRNAGLLCFWISLGQTLMISLISFWVYPELFRTASILSAMGSSAAGLVCFLALSVFRKRYHPVVLTRLKLERVAGR